MSPVTRIFEIKSYRYVSLYEVHRFILVKSNKIKLHYNILIGFQ